MLPTPSTTHVSFANIYEPAEDSFLLLDTITTEAPYLSARFQHSPTPLVLEVGPGSGVVLAFAAAQAQPLFARRDILTLGIDLNPFACRATAQTVTTAAPAAAPLFLGALEGDLAACVRSASVDVLLFNPPYVPSETLPAARAPTGDVFARDNGLLALATDGGAAGMETTDRLLDALPALLAARGVAYVLLCAQNRPEQVKARLQGWGAAGRGEWLVETVGSSGRTAGWERLQIVRVARRV